MSKLTLSLGVLEPMYMLEIMKQIQVDCRGKVIENLGGGGGGGGGGGLLSWLVSLTLLS